MRNVLTMAMLPMALVSGVATAAMAATGSNPLPDSGGVFLSYVNQPTSAGRIVKSPELALSVASGATTVMITQPVMDTGSVGIVISRDAFQGGTAGIDTGVAGSINYSSSGKTMSGTTGRASFTISGANGKSVTTDPIDFLIVDQVSCSKTARNCRATSHPTNIAMMGIGFGRQDKNGDETFTPARNPFTHIAVQADGARRGYVVTTTGVQVGINPMQIAGTDFALTKLHPDLKHQDEQHPGDDDFLPQTIAFTVNDQLVQGDVLIDTGVTDMYMTVPYANSEGFTTPACEDRRKKQPTYGQEACEALNAATPKDKYTSWTSLQPSTAVQIGILDGQDRPGISAEYGFEVGGTAVVAPNRLLLVGNLKAPESDTTPESNFVNTSVKFLNNYSYLFDQQDGFTGFRPVGTGPF